MKTIFPDNRKLRNLHRDLGYFFVGLIIAFSISGIAQNHRKQFKPDRYVYDYKKVHTTFHIPASSVTNEAVATFSKAEGLEDLRQFDIRKDSILIISYKDADATIHLTSGDGEINIWRKRPLLAQMSFLHKNNGNLWWILYSDIFALGLIFIAASGMFLMKGKNSFRKSGWKFALAGLLVPLMVLILLY